MIIASFSNAGKVLRPPVMVLLEVQPVQNGFDHACG